MDFRATGIYPYDPSVIPDEAFAPSELTVRDDMECEQYKKKSLEVKLAA